MSKDDLIAAIKKANSLFRANNFDEAYAAYRDIFSNPGFLANRAEDQRQALRLMIHAKNAPTNPTKIMIEAHRAAVAPLTELVSVVPPEPADYEMLGMCHALVGNENAAGVILREGLDLERKRNAGSDLCGAFMKRISML